MTPAQNTFPEEVHQDRLNRKTSAIVFVVQWSIGLLIDAFAALGLAQAASFQTAMGVLLCCCIASYGYFISAKADNWPQ